VSLGFERNNQVRQLLSRVGGRVNLLYQWIDARDYRDAWDYTVRFKRKLHEEALGKVELKVPEIDWDRWEEECALALGTPRKGSETDEED
jgi:hypothetical protein